MSSKLMQRPGSVVVVDDDLDYLEALMLALPAQWPLQCFANSTKCLEALRAAQPQALAERARIQTWIALSHDDKPMLGRVLADLLGREPPYSRTKVLVVDYAMPGKTGLDLLAQLPNDDMARVLLTGMADEQLAVQAFNQGLIEQFLQKHHPSVGQQLRSAISTQMARNDLLDSQIWRSVFETHQLETLSRPDIREVLYPLLDQRCVEYYFFSQPFGVLGFDINGRAMWLQIETLSSVLEAVEMARSEGVAPTLVEQLSVGEVLLSVELRQALGQHDLPVSARAQRLGQLGEVLVAWFDLPLALHRPAQRSYLAYCNQLPRRVHH